MRAKVISSGACLLCLLGCGWGEEDPTSRKNVQIDTVGTQVVVRNLWASTEELPHFRLRELWRVGGVAADEEAQFSGPFFTASFAPDGDAVLLDMARAEVSVFDGASGAVLQVLGGEGKGPGELLSPGGLVWDHLGRLWVANAFNGRYTIFGPDGTFLRTVPRPSRRVNGLQFSLVHTPSGALADHRSADPRLILLQVDSVGGVVDSLVLHQPERDPLQGGPLLPGSALREVTWLRPSLRWAFDADGSSVWALRSDSLRLIQVDWTGDTLRKVTTAHRSPSFSPAQREAIRKANQEMGREGEFTPIVAQSLHTMTDGRILVQIGSQMQEPSRGFDLFDSTGVLLGTVEAPLPVHHRSRIGSRGDTLVLPAVGEYDVPILMKAVLELVPDGDPGSRTP